MPVTPDTQQVASQSGLTVAALHTTPEGRSNFDLRGAFEARPPLTETLPRDGHAPLGGTGPSSRLMMRGWGHLKRVTRRLDDHWIGDLLGAISLFVIAYGALVIGWGMQ